MLTSEDFSRVARELQTALTDEVIEASIDRLPDGYREQVGEELRTAFYHRRDDLPRFAREWYDLLAGWVDVHSTDDDERATVEWTADGGAHVRIEAVEDEPSRVVFERRFSPDETREVRVYLHGGDDELVIQGERPGPHSRPRGRWGRRRPAPQLDRSGRRWGQLLRSPR